MTKQGTPRTPIARAALRLAPHEIAVGVARQIGGHRLPVESAGGGEFAQHAAVAKIGARFEIGAKQRIDDAPLRARRARRARIMNQPVRIERVRRAPDTLRREGTAFRPPAASAIAP